jgi:hypothetical protein
MSQEKNVVLDPSGERRAVKNQSMAKRCSSLDGKGIGFLSNGKPNASLLMRELEHVLSRKYRFTKIMHREKPKASIAATFFDELADDCHVVVNGVGD